jgi:hypothetical protein
MMMFEMMFSEEAGGCARCSKAYGTWHLARINVRVLCWRVLARVSARVCVCVVRERAFAVACLCV